MKKQLVELAHARSGDKGDIANIALFAPDQATYDLLVREVTTERVRTHFAGIVTGKVERFEGSQFCTSRRLEWRRFSVTQERCPGEVALICIAEDGDRGIKRSLYAWSVVEC